MSKSDDAISRQAAIEEIARWIGYIDEDMILRIQTGLKKLPSVQPERKTGRWIKNQRKSMFHIEPVYICSCCREQEAWGEMELSNYCPNCGAKMEGEER